MSKNSSILITVLLIDNNRWWSHSSNVEHQFYRCGCLNLVNSVSDRVGEVLPWLIHVFDSNTQRVHTSVVELVREDSLNQRWMARVEAGRMGRSL